MEAKEMHLTLQRTGFVKNSPNGKAKNETYSNIHKLKSENS